MITKRIHGMIRQDFGLTPRMGAELEWYLEDVRGADLEALLKGIRNQAARDYIAIEALESERGAHQYEVKLAPNTPEALAVQVSECKALICQAAQAAGGRARFEAKPYDGRPGCGLHLHLSLYDDAGYNVFTKTKDDRYSDSLRYVIGGLQALMLPSMVFFAPSDVSYARFQPDLHTPVNNSWGANNRTCALRLPDCPPHDKRIEHRVPGADCDPAHAIAAVLAGAHYGLAQMCDPGEKQFGNAAVAEALEKLPYEIKIAQKLFEKNGKIMKNYGFSTPEK